MNSATKILEVTKKRIFGGGGGGVKLVEIVTHVKLEWIPKVDSQGISNGGFFASLAIRSATSLVTGEFATTEASDVEFDVFFDLRLNKRMRKQSRRWWWVAIALNMTSV